MTTRKNNGLAGEAYVIVRESILRGQLPAGAVISRRKVAAQLGMSFLPVSEAFVRLEHEGLLESRPGAGTRVRIPTRQDVRGHYVVREALEVQAARIFAEIATAEERRELQELATRVDTMSFQAGVNRFAYLGLHEDLHRRIAECTRCPALCGALMHTRALSSTWLCAGGIGFPNLHPHRRHQNLMEVLANRDCSVAGEAMRAHVQWSMETVMERLEPYFCRHETSGASYSRGANRQFAVELLMNSEAVG